jgi:FkbM family methyltransferase
MDSMTTTKPETKTKTKEPKAHIKSRGLKFPKDGTYLTGKVRGLLKSGAYERDLAAAALKATREGDIVLDLGCGLGFLCGILAKRRKVAAIHGYDGNAKLLGYAEAMLAANGITGVTLTPGVLGKRKATAPFYVRAPFAASSLVGVEGDDAVETEVEMHNIKTVLATVTPSVIICDIEGDEAELLEGADLTGVRQVVIKLHAIQLGHAGLRKLFDAMSAAGFAYDPRISAGRIVSFIAA